MHHWAILLLIAIAAAGSGWAYRQHRYNGRAWGPTLTLVLGLVAGELMVFYLLILAWTPSVDIPPKAAVPHLYRKVGYERLGAYLGTNYPKAKAVLVTNVMVPGEDPNTPDNMAVAALKQGIGGRLDIIATKNFGPPKDASGASGTTHLPPPMMLIPDVMITAKDWNELLKEHPDADMFITFAGLPQDVEKMGVWKMKDAERPKIILVNEKELSMLYAPIARGMIQAVLHPNPTGNYDPNKPVTEDPTAVFNERWLLITPDNVKKVAREHKGLFMVDFKDEPKATGTAQ